MPKNIPINEVARAVITYAGLFAEDRDREDRIPLILAYALNLVKKEQPQDEPNVTS